MLKGLSGALGVAMLLAAPAALAQDEIDDALFEQGQQLYGANCAACHQTSGAGLPPTFPALSGNANLEDIETIVTTVHEGRGAMPPFPNFGADDLAALATYIRNAWNNDFGPVSREEAAAFLEGGEPSETDDGAEPSEADDAVEPSEGAEQISVWDGVFTQEQADRGRMLALSTCAECHGERLDGAALDPDRTSAPPLARARFLRNWDGQSVGGLFEYIRATMPPASPGFMSDEQYLDIIAYMFGFSDLPPGDEELGAGAPLASIVITAEP